MITFIWILLAFVLSLSACSGREGVEWGGEIVQEEGIPHLYNPDTPLLGNDASPFVEEEVLGGPGSPEDALFTTPCAMAFGSDGTRYILDHGDARILRFAPDGSYAGSFGRRGQGPGEFSDPTDLEMLPDDTLVVADWSSMRISFFSPEGKFIRSFKRQRYAGQIAVVGGDRLYVHEQPRTLQVATRFTGTGFSQMAFLFDLIDLYGEGESGIGILQEYEGIILGAWMNRVYLAAAPGDTLLVNTTCHDRIEVYAPDGSLTRVVHRQLPFEPIEPVEKQEVHQEGESTQVTMQLQFDILSTGLAIDPGGEYWAVMVAARQTDRREDVEPDERRPEEWAVDLFDTAGRWLARQLMGSEVQMALLEWGPDGLYILNQAGDATVRRYRIR